MSPAASAAAWTCCSRRSHVPSADHSRCRALARALADQVRSRLPDTSNHTSSFQRPALVEVAGHPRGRVRGPVSLRRSLAVEPGVRNACDTTPPSPKTCGCGPCCFGDMRQGPSTVKPRKEVPGNRTTAGAGEEPSAEAAVDDAPNSADAQGRDALPANPGRASRPAPRNGTRSATGALAHDSAGTAVTACVSGLVPCRRRTGHPLCPQAPMAWVRRVGSDWPSLNHSGAVIRPVP